MEIVVKGKAQKSVAPNEVTISLKFSIKKMNCDDALESGMKFVQSFIKEVMIPLGFSKDDLKTSTFTLKEEEKYDRRSDSYIFNGFSFNQNAQVTFDYDIKKTAKMLQEISKMSRTPKCTIVFGVKDEGSYRDELLSSAYKDAEKQAQAIAKAAGKTLKRCVKINSESSMEFYDSNMTFEPDLVDADYACLSDSSAMEESFTPQDVKLEASLHSQWLAE